jgi:hypothetical protein
LGLATIALFLAATLHSAFAAEEAKTPKARPGRYLLVVDTSSSMSRYAKNAHKVVNDLLLTGMSGELHAGDTIGVWTFNEELFTGQLPLQLWTPEAQEDIAKSVTDFLQGQPFRKDGRLENVLPVLSRLIKSSEKITVLLVTSVDTKLTGIPYERDVGRAYTLSRDEMRKQRMPFITVLRGWRGALIGGSANSGASPVEFPGFPPDPPPADNLKAAPKTPTVAPQPLIVIGKKPEPVAQVQTGAPPETIAAPNAVAQATSETSADVAVSSAPTPPESLAATPRDAAVPSVQTAVVATPEARPERTLFLVVGGAALITALGLVFLLVRRQHSSPHTSLITRSMDRKED